MREAAVTHYRDVEFRRVLGRTDRGYGAEGRVVGCVGSQRFAQAGTNRPSLPFPWWPSNNIGVSNDNHVHAHARR